MTQPGTAFNAAGGHTEKIVYGPTAPDGSTTILKPTTAWEVLWYLAISCASSGSARLTSTLDIVAEEGGNYTDAVKDHLKAFLGAAGALANFTPVPFTFAFPEAYRAKVHFPPLRQALLDWPTDRAVIAQLDTKLVSLLFIDLFVSLTALEAADACFDGTAWSIGLVDITAGMAHPCVLDVKVGYVRHSPHTDPVKIARLEKKDHEDSLVKQIGLRVTGARHFHRGGEVGSEWVADSVDSKQLGYDMTEPTQMRRALHSFFSTAGPFSITESPATRDTAREHAAMAFVSKLHRFLTEDPHGLFLIREMAFVSASVLFCYDAESDSNRMQASLIDFGRSGTRKLNYSEERVGFVESLGRFSRLFD